MGATTTTVVVTVLSCGVVALVVVLLVTRSRAAEERARRERLEHDLEQARTDVAALSRRLDHLGREVVDARHTADRAAASSDRLASRTEREFVITSLGDAGPARAPAHAERAPRSPASVLEDKLVSAARRSGGSSAAAVATGLAVRAASLGHGVRRALSPEVLDRAAAASTVARRRSRRDRKRELREARRMVRAVHEGPSGKHVA